MESTNLSANIRKCLLALGPESDGNFSVFHKGVLYRSGSFGDLLNEEIFEKFRVKVLTYFKKNKLKPDVIITDLHPLYRTTLWGEQLSKKYGAKHIKIQHHISHIFSAIGDRLVQDKRYALQDTMFGIACDGTGYGPDGNIWGGEIFKVKSLKFKVKSIERIAHLENQILIGGDLAVKEPARMLIGILNKFLPKDEVYRFVRKFYVKNKFDVLCSQLKQNFNCQETSSTARILDAVSVLLGFSVNKREYKHGPAIALEDNSTTPYVDLKPVVTKSEIRKPKTETDSIFILETTPLFEYLVKNMHKDKHRLAATAQLYLAQGLYEVLKMRAGRSDPENGFFAGGIANNKIIALYLERKGIYVSKKIPRGDAGISFGQIVHYLLTDSRY